MRSTTQSLIRRQVGRGGALLLGAVLLGAGACGVDDSREMYIGTQAGSSGSSLSDAGVGSNTQAASSSGGQGGEGGDPTNQAGTQSMSGSAGKGGPAGTSGTGGTSSTSAGGSSGHAGKGGTGAVNLCGNNKLDSDEECDDGNTKSGDGCSSMCKSKCEACEEDVPKDDYLIALINADYYFDCYKATDYATAGPAAGAPRAELCADVVDCVRRTGCATLVGAREGLDISNNKASANVCWCLDRFEDPAHPGTFTPDAPESCFHEDTVRPGPCIQEFQAASERDDLNGIGVNWIATDTGLGRAVSLLAQTDAYGCREECLPLSFDPHGSMGGGGTGGGAGSGGTAGTGGTSGGNGGGTGGTGAGASGGATGGTSGTGGGGTGGGGTGGGGTGGGGTGGGGTGGGGTSGGSSNCGNGTLDQGEECEPPSSQTCSDTCQRISNDDCVACEQAGACVATSDGCLNFAGDERRRCFAVQECITDTNCGDGTNTLTSCFCGNMSTADCIAAPNTGAGVPAGPCAKEIRAGMSLGGVPATNNDVLVRYIDEGVPGGFAISRYFCDKVDPECLTVCGF